MVKDLITNKDAERKIETGENVMIIDARTEDIYTEDSDQVQGAIHLTQTAAQETYQYLPKDKEYLIYTTKGEEDTSKKFADFLRDKGYTAYAIQGGVEDWRDSGLPIEPINARGTPLL